MFFMHMWQDIDGFLHMWQDTDSFFLAGVGVTIDDHVGNFIIGCCNKVATRVNIIGFIIVDDRKRVQGYQGY